MPTFGKFLSACAEETKLGLDLVEYVVYLISREVTSFTKEKR